MEPGKADSIAVLRQELCKSRASMHRAARELVMQKQMNAMIDGDIDGLVDALKTAEQDFERTRKFVHGELKYLGYEF